MTGGALFLLVLSFFLPTLPVPISPFPEGLFSTLFYSTGFSLHCVSCVSLMLLPSDPSCFSGVARAGLGSPFLLSMTAHNQAVRCHAPKPATACCAIPSLPRPIPARCCTFVDPCTPRSGHPVVIPSDPAAAAGGLATRFPDRLPAPSACRLLSTAHMPQQPALPDTPLSAQDTASLDLLLTVARGGSHLSWDMMLDDANA
eukprot:GGOE01056243.1.p1 GENE.GGOE01056243.1~~GGOE01056243.1.p1  ORF type:complete len:201 (-),score=10.75 GGOE01056243.1:1088-1690(-)